MRGQKQLNRWDEDELTDNADKVLVILREIKLALTGPAHLDKLVATITDGKRWEKHHHKQVRVQYGNRRINVDEGMAPLLKALWRREIDTCLSCQENRPGVAWISFMSAYDAEAFMNLAWDLGDPDMKLRIEQAGWGGDWEYNINPDRIDDEMGFHAFVSVRFPVSDLEYLTRHLA